MCRPIITMITPTTHHPHPPFPPPFLRDCNFPCVLHAKNCYDIEAKRQTKILSAIFSINACLKLSC